MNNKIFIIEDEEKIRLELSTFLNRYGYETSYSTDFENIVDISLKEEPDIILLDINLPYYDGYYICREIRRKSNVPIIVVTSRNSEVDELMSMNLGADDFITKPYNTQILLARIASIIRRTYQNLDSEVFELNEILKEDSQKNIDDFEDMDKKENFDIKITSVIKEGSPAKEILKVAEEEDVDLIIIGSSGKSKFDKFLMGSVADKVSKHASCSVMVIH